jgi:hypothetical protein
MNECVQRPWMLVDTTSEDLEHLSMVGQVRCDQLTPEPRRARPVDRQDVPPLLHQVADHRPPQLPRRARDDNTAPHSDPPPTRAPVVDTVAPPDASGGVVLVNLAFKFMVSSMLSQIEPQQTNYP